MIFHMYTFPSVLDCSHVQHAPRIKRRNASPNQRVRETNGGPENPIFLKKHHMSHRSPQNKRPITNDLTSAFRSTQTSSRKTRESSQRPSGIRPSDFSGFVKPLHHSRRESINKLFRRRSTCFKVHAAHCKVPLMHYGKRFEPERRVWRTNDPCCNRTSGKLAVCCLERKSPSAR